MAKSAKKRLSKPRTTAVPGARTTHQTAGNPKSTKSDRASKQSRVIAMLRSSEGATIAAMMKATGWQQHSVRGLLAGVVRKQLKLNLGSNIVDGNRVYQIDDPDRGKFGSPKAKRRSP